MPAVFLTWQLQWRDGKFTVGVFGEGGGHVSVEGQARKMSDWCHAPTWSRSLRCELWAVG